MDVSTDMSWWFPAIPLGLFLVFSEAFNPDMVCSFFSATLVLLALVSGETNGRTSILGGPTLKNGRATIVVETARLCGSPKKIRIIRSGFEAGDCAPGLPFSRKVEQGQTEAKAGVDWGNYIEEGCDACLSRNRVEKGKLKRVCVMQERLSTGQTVPTRSLVV